MKLRDVIGWELPDHSVLCSCWASIDCLLVRIIGVKNLGPSIWTNISDRCAILNFEIVLSS